MDIEQVREHLRRNGWCQAYQDDVLYNTIRNCTKDSLARAYEEGWELVGIFRGSDYSIVSDVAAVPNCTVFRRKAPAFFHAENPWREKGPHAWLPNLTTGVSETMAVELANAGGHGCPIIARRFRCRCGSFHVTACSDPKMGRLDVNCAKCGSRSCIISHADYLGDFDSLTVVIPTLIGSWLRSRKKKTEGDPFRYAKYSSWFGFLRKPQPVAGLQPYRCQCGNDRITLDLGIEYPVAAVDGWDFSWLIAAATCFTCKEHATFFTVDTSG